MHIFVKRERASVCVCMCVCVSVRGLSDLHSELTMSNERGFAVHASLRSQKGGKAVGWGGRREGRGACRREGFGREGGDKEGGKEGIDGRGEEREHTFLSECSHIDSRRQHGRREEKRTRKETERLGEGYEGRGNKGGRKLVSGTVKHEIRERVSARQRDEDKRRNRQQSQLERDIFRGRRRK